jgi:hypothetical protein
MFKFFIATVVSVLMVSSASAGCIGSGAFKSCTDNSGNSYTISKFGNSTMVNGYNSKTGSNWSQNSMRSGNTTFTTGNDADGNSWNSTTMRSGTQSYTFGTDSDGNSFSSTCGAFGCN